MLSTWCGWVRLPAVATAALAAAVVGAAAAAAATALGEAALTVAVRVALMGAAAMLATLAAIVAVAAVVSADLALTPRSGGVIVGVLAALAADLGHMLSILADRLTALAAGVAPLIAIVLVSICHESFLRVSWFLARPRPAWRAWHLGVAVASGDAFGGPSGTTRKSASAVPHRHRRAM